MKPKIFVGSSVEGLTAAYSIQQNLTHDAEVTVWDQGVFELSRTTIESLNSILEKSDFGIFIFTPDDISKIRDKENSLVRDNVLFEFGLFVGKLSRERVYFIIPTGIEFHLPTDLLGITPGSYNPNREDKSLQAAMGPVCHQIRIQIKKLGLLNPPDEISEEPVNDSETEVKAELTEDFWQEIFVKKNYPKALQLLEKDLTTEIDDKKILEYKIWIAYTKLKLDETDGNLVITELLKEYEKEIGVYRAISTVYTWHKDYDKAIEVLNIALQKFENDPTIVALLGEYYKDNGDEELAENLLRTNIKKENVDISYQLFDILNSQKNLEEAKKIIHQAYVKNPKNEKIRFAYAKLAIDKNENELALFLLDSLTKEFPTNILYWGYLSNSCINLMLYDLGMIACKKANELADEKQDWLIMNIGNMLKNKGFYTEAITYLERGLEINKASEYGHDRLASSLKSIQEEQEKSKKMITLGKKQLKEFVIEIDV